VFSIAPFSGADFFYNLNEAVHVTAARLRFLLNLKGLVWAAARDGVRSAAGGTA
jgi:hypothetical protein